VKGEWGELGGVGEGRKEGRKEGKKGRKEIDDLVGSVRVKCIERKM
jgi:hypothetical protein